MVTRPPFVVATGGHEHQRALVPAPGRCDGHQIRVRPLSRVAGVAGAVLVTRGRKRWPDVDDDEVLVYEQCSAVSGDHLEGHARYERLYQTLQYETSQHKTSQHRHDAQPAGDDRTLTPPSPPRRRAALRDERAWELRQSSQSARGAGHPFGRRS